MHLAKKNKSINEDKKLLQDEAMHTDEKLKSFSKNIFTFCQPFIQLFATVL